MLNDSLFLDRTFAALADPARRGMLVRLAQGPASVSELAAPLPISLSAVLQHLQALEASGLICTEKKGRVRTCRIEPTALSAAEAWIADQRAAWEARLDRFEDHLNAITPQGDIQ
jgi:DNA-binding transcriptional ArsR family regulator